MSNVRQGARERASSMLRRATGVPSWLASAIVWASTYHDLGKLDPIMQAVLQAGRSARLSEDFDHIDAGVAHLSGADALMAAWLVRAHHSPGLPKLAAHFDRDGVGFRLRGRRNDVDDRHRHEKQIARTDARLPNYLVQHTAVLGSTPTSKISSKHGLTMRLALSCLVDADHSDSAFADTLALIADPPPPRWGERLQRLREYVASLPPGESEAEKIRNGRRAAFFDACLNSNIDGPLTSCEGPVGLGKTTAVMAHLLARAQREGLRRVFIVAPYTNILRQTADRLRRALVLPGERANSVIVEHHHRADFEAESDRELAVLWHAPIVLTTAVSFFETLGACDPASLRKLHAVPGSAVFVDEAHAALPTKLWPQNWRWVRELAEHWGCRFVFASGSLARFWEDPEIVGEPLTLPELLPRVQEADVLAAERNRVRFTSLRDGRVISVDELCEAVRSVPAPRLVILNTVQNAAVVARAMRDRGMDVLHLSTALTPRDRERILKRATRRLQTQRRNWALVATSCVEAGVDLSFRTAFRERFGTASIIQVGGRVNRHGEHDATQDSIVYDFALAGEGITQHPAATISADVLREIMKSDSLNAGNPAEVVTRAMREELRRLPLTDHAQLLKAEADRDYPLVAELSRVIDADTRLVVVDKRIIGRLTGGKRVGFRALLRGSVQLWATKIEKLGLAPLPGRADLYVWHDAYEPEFLGIMAGVLRTDNFISQGGGVI
ncbi:MAG TPA: DEAD/DEAH box helicase [Tepidisphaeraceae bacterium]